MKRAEITESIIDRAGPRLFRLHPLCSVCHLGWPPRRTQPLSLGSKEGPILISCGEACPSDT